MQHPLQITFRGLQPSDGMERRIRAKAAELERFYEPIVSCRVTVDAQHKRRHNGNIYAVRLDIHLPDKEIVVGRERYQHHAHENVYVALRDAFATAVRQLEDYARKRRRRVKRHRVKPHGKVSKLFRDGGYGFVQLPEGVEVYFAGIEVYFHENSVVGADFRALEVGDEVRVVLAEGEKGPQASAIIPTGKRHTVGWGDR